MLTVRFFARLRERLGESELVLPLAAGVDTLQGLQDSLAGRGEPWRDALAEPNLVRAVNHEVVHEDCPLRDGDEVAFYPPVTGG